MKITPKSALVKRIGKKKAQKAADIGNAILDRIDPSENTLRGS